MSQVHALLQQQRFDEAKTLCARLCKANKKDAEGWGLLGSIYGNLNDMSGAIKCFMKVAKLQPNNYQVYFNLSVAQQRHGDLDSSAKNLLRAIRLKGDFFEAHYNLADVYRQLGQMEQALDYYRKAAQINPGYALLHMNIGTILYRQGNYDDAITSHKKSIELEPEYDEVYVNLGLAYAETGEFDEAEAAFRKAISINPAQPRAYLQLGLLNYKKEDFQEAHTCLTRSISLDQANPVSHYNLGIVLKEMAKLDEAMSAFKQAMALNPEYVDAYHGLASAQRETGAIDEAIETFDMALKFRPEKSTFYLDFASVMGLVGHQMEAITYNEKAIETGPDSAELQLAYAYALLGINEYDRAIVAFERSVALAEKDDDKQMAIAGSALILERRKQYDDAYNLIKPFLIEPVNPRVAQAFGNIARKLNMSDEAIGFLKSALDNEDTQLDSKSEIEFLLGKLYDANNDFDNAFQYYHAGNETFRSLNNSQISKYKVDKDKHYMEQIKSVFTKEFFESHEKSDCLSERPVFVVGMPRSGTTLTESIISSHPLAFPGGEMYDISDIRKATEAGTGQVFPEAIKYMAKDKLNEFAQHYLGRLDLKNKDAHRVVDKMPHNFLLLGIIALLFPKAHIIHIQRYPVDNCLSIYFQRFNLSHTYSSNLKDLGEYYRCYFDLMNHWNEVLPMPILNIRYDELVVNQEAMTHKMIDFCGLEWDEQCLAFHKSKRDVGTPSYDQVSQPMYDKSSGRWKNYNNYITDLVEVLENNRSIIDFESL